LTPGEAYDLEDRDRIVLARDEVVLTFSVAHPTGSETWDYAESQSEAPAAQKPGPAVNLDRERREVIIDGRVLVFRGRLWNLVCLLHENRRRVVSTVEIKRVVWPERESGADGMPLVTNEEVATLVYRLRNRLAPYADLIRTFPGDGYMLDVE
jgi:DNA-binding response OmpR family regulator